MAMAADAVRAKARESGLGERQVLHPGAVSVRSEFVGTGLTDGKRMSTRSANSPASAIREEQIRTSLATETVGALMRPCRRRTRQNMRTELHH